MSKQLSDTPVKPDEQVTPSNTGGLPALKMKEPAVFWPWLGGLLVVGLVIVGVVTLSVWNWLNNIQSGMGTNSNSPSVSTLNVGRNAFYGDLNITWTDVQYTTSFSDDPVHSGAATARVTLSVNNPTTNTIVIAYYDVVRLLVPGQDPIAPTNLSLSAAPQKGATLSGWLDFPVAKNLKLDSLKLRFGNAATNELLVTIPAQGKYTAGAHKIQTFHPNLTVYYYFKDYVLAGQTLTYRLTGVDVRDSYNGVETKNGQQFYTVHWAVDNPNGVSVNPGKGFDYLRLVLNSYRVPMDSTLPTTGFKAGAHGVSGSVTFAGPAGLRSLTIAFLKQNVAGDDRYTISW